MSNQRAQLAAEEITPTPEINVPELAKQLCDLPGLGWIHRDSMERVVTELCHQLQVELLRKELATERAAREKAEQERDSSRHFSDSLMANLNEIRIATEWLDDGCGPNTATALAIKAANELKRIKELQGTHDCGCEICSRTSKVCPATTSSYAMALMEAEAKAGDAAKLHGIGERLACVVCGTVKEIINAENLTKGEHRTYCNNCQTFTTHGKPQVDAGSVMELGITVSEDQSIHTTVKCGTGRSFEEVLFALHLSRAEIDNQIAQRALCPFSKGEPEPPQVDATLEQIPMKIADGWTVDFDFLQAIAIECMTETEGVSLEMVEAVILALAKRRQVSISAHARKSQPETQKPAETCNERLLTIAKRLQSRAQVFGLRGATNHPAVKCEVRETTLGDWQELSDAISAAESLPKTMEGELAAPGKSSDSWRVHILGPDDIIPMPNEVEALRQCNMTNIVLANLQLKYANDPNYPWSMAVVERNGIEYTEPQFDAKTEGAK